MVATTTERNSLATKFGQDAAYGALFTADPGTTGTVTGEVTGGTPAYARKALTWGTAANGAVTASATFDVPAATTVTYVGVCTASSGATLIDRATVTSQNFATQGTFLITFTFTES
jgi:hypothetical protein